KFDDLRVRRPRSHEEIILQAGWPPLTFPRNMPARKPKTKAAKAARNSKPSAVPRRSRVPEKKAAARVLKKTLPAAPALPFTAVDATPPKPAPEPISERDRPSYDGDTAIKLYLREIGQVKLLTVQEEIDLAAKIKKGDKKAREQMIKANLRLVVKIAHDYEGFGLPLLDLI